MEKQEETSAEVSAAASSAKLKWDSQPFSPENSLRARKDTITMSTRKIRSFLDDQNPELLEEANWLSVMGNPSTGSSSRRSSFVLEKSQEKAVQYGAEINNLRHTTEASLNLTQLVGFLVSFDNGVAGETYALRVGRWIVSSVPLGLPGTTMVIEDKSIAAVHATLSISDNAEVRVQDHFSPNGTGLTPNGAKEEVLIKDSASTLAHGDIVRFGERKFKVTLIPNS